MRWRATAALDATLGGRFRSSRHRPDSFDEPHLGGSAQGAYKALGDFHGYSLLNLGASYRLSRQHQIENPLDKSFVDYRAYPLRNDPETTAFSNVYNNILEPRRLWISLRASL